MNWKLAFVPAMWIAAAVFAQQQPPATTTQPPATSTQPPATPSIPEGTQLPSEVGLEALVPVPVKNVAATDRVTVTLNDGKHDYAASAKVDGGSVVFTLPKDAQPARYTVRITVNEKTTLAVPGELRVAGAAQEKPVITGVSTPVYPPDQGGDLYSFSILGDHFGNDQDTSVEIAQRAIRSEAPGCSETTHTPCIKVAPHVIEVFGFAPKRFEGPVKVAVRVGSLHSDSMDLTFSHYRIRSIRFFAFIGTLFIALVVYLLVRRGVGLYQIGHEHYSVFSIFIIDKDTHSYSLSKLQLLLWTCASVFTYIYFYLCRILIQWSSEFPDVPSGMATLIGLSAGTTVAAAGLTAARGPKGAGPLSPTPADFISSGGVVVAERFQFFVWTIVGVLSFVGVVLNSDPAHLSTLPSIPDNFLALMGVSSAGYLAGKAVRKAGPVISRVDASGTVSGDKLVLKVDGQNFEQKAKIHIDKQDYTGKAKVDEGALKAQEGSANFYTHLEWTIPWQDVFNAPTLVLEIQNEDGQLATYDVALKPFRITSVSDAQASKNEVAVTATVENAVGTFEGEWIPPGATTEPAVAIPASKITVKGNSVEIRLTPGDMPGIGKLSLIDSSRQRALASVKVTT